MRAWWTGRSPGERRTIAIAVAVLGAALLAMLWLQAERSRTRLAAELPALRASLAALERDAQEAKRLRALPARAAGGAAPVASLASGGVPGARLTVLDERRVRLSGEDVAFAAVLDWLAAAGATHGLRVQSARIEALAAAGRVKADIVLARS